VREFPEFAQWCFTVLNEQDTTPWNFRTIPFYQHYKSLYRVSRMLQPRSIMEVGVRFGYGAHALLTGAYCSATYTGIDFNEPSWGPYSGVPAEWAIEMLRRTCVQEKLQVFDWDTQKPGMPPEFKGIAFTTDFDLVHIDACHSFEGALSDMHKFWPYCTRAMLVDDYDDIRTVHYAVCQFTRDSGALLYTNHTSQGSALLIK